MELYFNELSAQYKTPDRHQARERMKTLLLLCKNATQEGFMAIRTHRSFDVCELCHDYKVCDWYSDGSISKTLRDFYLSFRKFPFETGNTDAEETFIKADYTLHEPEEALHHGQSTGGLAWAYIMNTLAVSFQSHPVWKKPHIQLMEALDGASSVRTVNHSSQEDHIALHAPWIESLKKPVLISSDIEPFRKTISLRDDHGKDTLKSLAQKIVQSPYVTGVINSLPFHSKAKNFIYKVHSDGRIEIVLVWTDQGYGMVVQTTGRSMAETKAIAELLKDKYE